ncbi:Histidine kinase [Pedobacter terrae]|uniref:Histidine kinase n=2 Tax=Pedobacter terrae TaxID=405671 RepID=A0A1G7PZ06_9SPHI|nr:Histidine kinase [Pedobacter terrae]
MATSESDQRMKRFLVISLRTVGTTSNGQLKREISYQTGLWIALFVFRVFRNYGELEQPDFREIFYYDVCHWIFQIIGANWIYFFLIRRFFEAKKYFPLILYFIAGMYILGVINRIFIVYAAEPLFANYPQDSITNILTEVKHLLFYYILPIISGSFIFVSMMIMLRYRNEKQNALQLQKEKSELELKALKAQLNPHFLFNTLNNIYSLSITGSSAVSQSISRLSDILDYILYHGQKEMVSVTAELKIVKDYIALQMLRYDERLKIEIEEKVEFPGFIPPLLYLSFVENAFKHGAEKTSGIVTIRISIETHANAVHFRVENQFFGKCQEMGTGIGLVNTRKQLDLYYPNQYSLEIKQANNWFTIELMTPII